jgi:hypothetical protein
MGLTIAIARDRPVPQRMNTHAQPPRHLLLVSELEVCHLPLGLVLALRGYGFDREPQKDDAEHEPGNPVAFGTKSLPVKPELDRRSSTGLARFCCGVQ